VRTLTSVKPANEGRQKHEGEDHRQILDDKPADRYPAIDRLKYTTIFQGTKQHDCARN
jgi:hypothetical protein